MPRIAAVLSLALLIACGDDSSTPDASRPTDATAPTRDGRTEVPPPCRGALPVDLLWVVDNSNSMEQEQNNLAANFPRLIQRLVDPPDTDRDGEPDYPGVTDLRVGVISTDFGVGDNTGVANCDMGTGDGGALIGESRAAGPCAGFTTGDNPWLEYDGDTDAFAENFSCLAKLGTDGCGLEQQLEASLAAISTQSSDGGANEGFLRPDSLVAIVFVTDEDDCSTTNDELFSPSPAAATTYGPYPMRCANHPGELHPIRRYAQAFDTLRLDRNNAVIVAAITGVPRELARNPLEVDFAAVLADDRMQFAENPDNPGTLRPACEYGGVASAPPGRRIIEVIQEFSTEGDGLLASICEPDLGPVLESIAARIGSRVCEEPI